MSMIICNECGKEFSDKAPACPNCGCPNNYYDKFLKKPFFVDKPKESDLSTIAALLSIFVFTFVFGFIIAIIDLVRNDTTKKHRGSWFALIFGFLCIIAIVDKANDIPESKTNTKQNQFIDNTILSTGSEFRIEDMLVTVKEIDLNYTDYEDEYGWYDLEDGMKYIKIGFEYLNSGKEDTYVSIYDYKCYADGSLCEQTYYFGGDFINTNLSANRKVYFEIFFIVPMDAKEIELETKPNMFDDEKIILKLQ